MRLCKYTKSVLSFTVLILVAGLIFSLGNVGDVKASQKEILLYNADKGETLVEKVDDNDYGIQFAVDAPVKAFEVYVDSASSSDDLEITISLYKWNESYAKSISAQPVASNTLIRYASDSWIGVTANDPLPAGEYLALITNAVKSTKIVYSDEDVANTCLYYNASSRAGTIQARVLVEGEGSLKEISDNNMTYSVSPDTWVVTDGLNRVINNTYSSTAREDKYVGIFFHTWHSTKMHVNNGFRNVTEILEANPGLDVTDINNPVWGRGPAYFWNEPIWGYYRTTDEWVLRRQGELLADAMIDVVFFDTTNGPEIFLEEALTLLKVWSQARADGVNTPDIAFMLPMFDFDYTATQLRLIYEHIYSKGLYEDMWFYWKGKPLVLAYPGTLYDLDPVDSAILDFFQYRVISHTQSSDGIQVMDREGNCIVGGDNSRFINEGFQLWNWISAYPQLINKNPDGTPEQMAVSVSHNWCKETHLTAFSNQFDTVYSRDYIPTEDRYDDRENAKAYGAYFQAQWELALEVDPEFIFITGWNEWTAGRYEEFWGVTNALIDNFNDARSRDIEPSKGDLKDHYYYQMVSYIRQFKGMNAAVVETEEHAIDINGGMDQWDSVNLTYGSYAGDTFDRDERGYRSDVTNEYTVYEDTTGRNDLVSAKVAYDSEFITFMAETAEAITPYTDPSWMRLFIEIDSVNGAPVEKANWENYHFIINRNSPESDTVATLEASTGGWNWQEVGKVNYRVSGNRIMIQIPRTMLGIEGGCFTVNFKWADNTQNDGDIMEFYTTGDVAPGGRFQYQFTTDSSLIKVEKDEDKASSFSPLPVIIGVAAAAIVAAGIILGLVISRKKVSK